MNRVAGLHRVAGHAGGAFGHARAFFVFLCQPAMAMVATMGVAGLSFGASPYEDPRDRFRVTLSSEWRLAPRFGDVFGTTFERYVPEAGGTAVLTVHVDPVPAENLADFVQRVEGTWKGPQPLKRVSSRNDTVNGHDALVVEYVVRDDKTPRAIRSYFFEGAGRRFHVRIEIPAETLRALDAEIAAILATFHPGTSMKRVPAQGNESPGDSTGDIVGTWVGPTGAVLTIRADGTFLLEGRKGRYALDGHRLTMTMSNRTRLVFTVATTPDTITLIPSSKKDTLVYRRKAPKKPAHEKDASTKVTWTGRWTSKVDDGSLTLELRADGTFRLGPHLGRFVVDGDKMTLRGEKGESVTYRVEHSSDRLLLSGGDLDADLEFHRDPGG